MIASKRTTIKDIAKSLGVSTATVSQALRPNPGSNIKLPAETVKRVREAAKKLNYRAHGGARSIRAKVFGNLGFFTAKRGHAHPPDALLGGVHDAAEKAGFRITHIRLPENVDELHQELPSILTERHIDALLIGSYHPFSSVIHSELEGDNLPVIYLNDKHETNSVYTDDVLGAQLMTRHLIESGYRKIGFVMRKEPHNPPLEEMHHSAKDRIEGYTKIMEEAGLEASVRTVFANEIDVPLTSFPPDWESWVNSRDALFAYDDDLANQLGRLFYKQRIFVPDDIGLAGYNGDYGSQSAWQALTTVRLPSAQMGRAAFAMAQKLVENGNVKPLPSVKLAPRLILGESTR